MKYEYLVSFRHYGDKLRTNAMRYYNGKQVATTEEEARKAIEYVKKCYPEIKGEVTEKTETDRAGLIGISCKMSAKTQKSLQAVDFRIQRRTVGEWEEVKI